MALIICLVVILVLLMIVLLLVSICRNLMKTCSRLLVESRYHTGASTPSMKPCYLRSQQPDFKTIEYEGKKFATIKALTRFEQMELQDRAFKENGDVDMVKYAIIRIKQSLTGHEKCGWEIRDEAGEIIPVTEEVIADLSDTYFDLLMKAVTDLDSLWLENKDIFEIVAV